MTELATVRTFYNATRVHINALLVIQLRNQHARSPHSLDLLLSQLAEQLGLYDHGLAGELSLAKDLEKALKKQQDKNDE